MDIKVQIGFDKKTESLIERLVAVLGGMEFKNIEKDSVQTYTLPEVEVKPEPKEEIVETAIKEEVVEESVDYAALRAEAKKVSIAIVQKGKKKDALSIVKKYGAAKVSDVSDDNIKACLGELKALLED